ncbi:unnamed protein product [Durusdinium trenchii]|uniref:Uncharacterized protein n=1 Tax=Durusdinium trenchii TaxID=1381693 RepID=A0ABP0JYN7_9DINO
MGILAEESALAGSQLLFSFRPVELPNPEALLMPPQQQASKRNADAASNSLRAEMPGSLVELLVTRKYYYDWNKSTPTFLNHSRVRLNAGVSNELNENKDKELLEKALDGLVADPSDPSGRRHVVLSMGTAEWHSCSLGEGFINELERELYARDPSKRLWVCDRIQDYWMDENTTEFLKGRLQLRMFWGNPAEDAEYREQPISTCTPTVREANLSSEVSEAWGDDRPVRVVSVWTNLADLTHQIVEATFAAEYALLRDGNNKPSTLTLGILGEGGMRQASEALSLAQEVLDARFAAVGHEALHLSLKLPRERNPRPSHQIWVELDISRGFKMADPTHTTLMTQNVKVTGLAGFLAGATRVEPGQDPACIHVSARGTRNIGRLVDALSLGAHFAGTREASLAWCCVPRDGDTTTRLPNELIIMVKSVSQTERQPLDVDTLNAVAQGTAAAATAKAGLSQEGSVPPQSGDESSLAAVGDVVYPSFCEGKAVLPLAGGEDLASSGRMLADAIENGGDPIVATGDHNVYWALVAICRARYFLRRAGMDVLVEPKVLHGFGPRNFYFLLHPRRLASEVDFADDDDEAGPRDQTYVDNSNLFFVSKTARMDSLGSKVAYALVGKPEQPVIIAVGTPRSAPLGIKAFINAQFYVNTDDRQLFFQPRIVSVPSKVYRENKRGMKKGIQLRLSFADPSVSVAE